MVIGGFGDSASRSRSDGIWKVGKRELTGQRVVSQRPAWQRLELGGNLLR